MDPICCVGGKLQCACSLIRLARFFVYDKMATIVVDRTSGISGVPGSRSFGYFSAGVSDWIE